MDDTGLSRAKRSLESAVDRTGITPLVRAKNEDAVYCCKESSCAQKEPNASCKDEETPMKPYAYQEETKEVVFDGFLEEDLHAVLRKVLYYVNPQTAEDTLLPFPLVEDDIAKYEDKLGTYSGNLFPQSHPWVAAPAQETVRQFRGDDAVENVAMQNGMCDFNGRCGRENTYLMDAFDIVGRYVPPSESVAQTDQTGVQEGAQTDQTGVPEGAQTDQSWVPEGAQTDQSWVQEGAQTDQFGVPEGALENVPTLGLGNYNDNNFDYSNIFGN